MINIDRAIEGIKHFEFKEEERSAFGDSDHYLEAYRLKNESWGTIVGCTYYQNGKRVQKGDRLTGKEAEELFNWMVKSKEEFMLSLVPNIIKDFDEFFYNAALSFFFNVSTTKISSSESNTLKNLKAGNLEESLFWMSKWCKGEGGVPLLGLKRRRMWEVKLALTGEHDFYHNPHLEKARLDEDYRNRREIILQRISNKKFLKKEVVAPNNVQPKENELLVIERPGLCLQHPDLSKVTYCFDEPGELPIKLEVIWKDKVEASEGNVEGWRLDFAQKWQDYFSWVIPVDLPDGVRLEIDEDNTESAVKVEAKEEFVGSTTTQTPTQHTEPKHSQTIPEKAIAWMRKYGLLVFDDLNIIYLRDGHPDTFAPLYHVPNRWNCARLLVDGQGKVIQNNWATTLAGTPWLGNEMGNEDGTFIAIDVTAQEVDIRDRQLKCWILGEHKPGHPALVQTQPGLKIIGWRDNNKDGNADRVGEIYRQDVRHVNQHHGHNSGSIGRNSAGCLVGRYIKSHSEFMDRVKSSEELKKNNFPTTIFPASFLMAL